MPDYKKLICARAYNCLHVLTPFAIGLVVIPQKRPRQPVDGRLHRSRQSRCCYIMEDTPPVRQTGCGDGLHTVTYCRHGLPARLSSLREVLCDVLMQGLGVYDLLHGLFVASGKIKEVKREQREVRIRPRERLLRRGVFGHVDILLNDILISALIVKKKREGIIRLVNHCSFVGLKEISVLGHAHQYFPRHSIQHAIITFRRVSCLCRELDLKSSLFEYGKRYGCLWREDGI